MGKNGTVAKTYAVNACELDTVERLLLPAEGTNLINHN